MATPEVEFRDPFTDPSSARGQRCQSRDADVDPADQPLTSRHDSIDERPRAKKRVGFSSLCSCQQDITAGESDGRLDYFGPALQRHHERSVPTDLSATTDIEDDRIYLPNLSPQDTQQIRQAMILDAQPFRPRPAIRPTPARDLDHGGVDTRVEEPQQYHYYKLRVERAQQALERGKRLERDERIRSAPTSRRSSPSRLQLREVAEAQASCREEVVGPTASEKEPFSITNIIPLERESSDLHSLQTQSNAEAFALVNGQVTDFSENGLDNFSPLRRTTSQSSASSGGDVEEYHKRPTHYRTGVLGALLKLHHNQNGPSGRAFGWSRPQSRKNSECTINGWSSMPPSPSASGTTTPVGRHSLSWFRSGHGSAGSLTTLVGEGSSPGILKDAEGGDVSLPLKKARPKRLGIGKRTLSSNALTALNRRLGAKPRLDDEIKITKHIAQTIQRQRYLQRLCRALMMYGAPTHRLEEYMTMSARVLEIDAQFLYIPGAMVMSFDDANTHTAEVKLVKAVQGLDLGKLRDVHEVYKEVVHDRIGVEEATVQLKEITSRGFKFSKWFRVIFYGLSAVTVGPYAFGAGLMDLPIAFILGCIVGILQLMVAPRSELYAHVFEISAAVITSFLARAFGSIQGGQLFCFSALAQSSIAIILPGYIVLCASLELQARSMVAGSVRMVYAVIYSLMLGFGITIGTATYGLLDSNATSATTCAHPMPDHWFFFFVPAFTICLIVINQGKWGQVPVMVFISFAGYMVSYWSSKRFAHSTQISSALGAFTIGVLANLYSRLGARCENFCLDLFEGKILPAWTAARKKLLGRGDPLESPRIVEDGTAHTDAVPSGIRPKTRRVGYSLAAAAMLPGIFVQVPSGLAANSSLISGVATANLITGHGISDSQGGVDSIVFNVAVSVILVAMGITVGLFLSAIVVYPVGKRRSGLFSF